MNPPTVFISYSHDSQEHKLWVLQLATRLRSCGVDAMLDQWDIGLGGDLPHFMEQGIAQASRVLMICSERYVEKANAGAGGVGYEKMIVTADLIQRIGATTVIPIVRQKGAVRLPRFLRSKLYIDLSSGDGFETGFDQLLRDLLGAPLFVKPPIGVAPTLAPYDAPTPTVPDLVDQLLRAFAECLNGSDENFCVPIERVHEIMRLTRVHVLHAIHLALNLDLLTLADDGMAICYTPSGLARMSSIMEDDGYGGYGGYGSRRSRYRY